MVLPHGKYVFGSILDHQTKGQPLVYFKLGGVWTLDECIPKDVMLKQSVLWGWGGDLESRGSIEALNKCTYLYRM